MSVDCEEAWPCLVNAPQYEIGPYVAAIATQVLLEQPQRRADQGLHQKRNSHTSTHLPFPPQPRNPLTAPLQGTQRGGAFVYRSATAAMDYLSRTQQSQPLCYIRGHVMQQMYCLTCLLVDRRWRVSLEEMSSVTFSVSAAVPAPQQLVRTNGRAITHTRTHTRMHAHTHTHTI